MIFRVFAPPKFPKIENQKSAWNIFWAPLKRTFWNKPEQNRSKIEGVVTFFSTFLSAFLSFSPPKNSQNQKSKICLQHFLSNVKTHLLKQTRAKSVKNWSRCYRFSIFTPPPILGPPSQNILDIQNLKIKNKIPHIGAPYATNRSKIGSKFAEI